MKNDDTYMYYEFKNFKKIMVSTRSILKRREDRRKMKGVKRKKLGKYLKLQVLANQLYKCNICSEKLITTHDDVNLFDYDHIEQHAQTGDDSIENIQAICLICHRKKSVREFRELYKSRGIVCETKLDKIVKKNSKENRFLKFSYK